MRLREMVAAWRRRRCEHVWRYGGTALDDPDPDACWTGYIEVCERCGAITQVPV